MWDEWWAWNRWNTKELQVQRTSANVHQPKGVRRILFAHLRSYICFGVMSGRTSSPVFPSLENPSTEWILGFHRWIPVRTPFSLKQFVRDRPYTTMRIRKRVASRTRGRAGDSPRKSPTRAPLQDLSSAGRISRQAAGHWYLATLAVRHEPRREWTDMASRYGALTLPVILISAEVESTCPGLHLHQCGESRMSTSLCAPGSLEAQIRRLAQQLFCGYESKFRFRVTVPPAVAKTCWRMRFCFLFLPPASLSLSFIFLQANGTSVGALSFSPSLVATIASYLVKERDSTHVSHTFYAPPPFNNNRNWKGKREFPLHFCALQHAHRLHISADL